MKQNSKITAKFLGKIEYQEALSLMDELKNQRAQGKIDDHLLFLEHPPVITMGRRDSSNDLHLGMDKLKQKGIPIISTDRGGKLTYHGPGQLVIYFIINLTARRMSISQLVWMAEEGVRLYLEQQGICATRDKKNPGLWIENQKIASIGFRIEKGISSHGLAFNVSGDLTPFNYFVPCGILEAGVTNLEKLTNQKIALKEVYQELSAIYLDCFTCYPKKSVLS